VEVETVVSGNLWNAVLDPNQLENVLLNLAINARDAMPDGGKLTLEVGNAMLDDDYVRDIPDLPPGQYVLVSISDTGCGMPKEVLERAVEPFFTTKREGVGTGLGLSMAFGFVKQSGGHFRLYSEVGHGTTVKMYFPRSHEAEAVVAVAPSSEVRGGTETILVVEDDLTVQVVVVELLRSLGYQVLKADDPDSALAVLRAGVRCDLLFTDVVMPGTMKSTELAHQAKLLLPDLQVLFTSGYTQNAIIHGGRLDPGVQLLSKPYRREDLARKVRQLLTERPQVSPEPAAAVPAPVPAPVVAAQAAAAGPLPGVQQPGRRILLVEDEPDAMTVTSELLTLLGHEVHGVASSEEAIGLLQHQQFDALFTDIHLPGMDGLALAHRLKRQQPGLALIFASGDGRVGGEVRQLGGTFLRKPYSLADLRELFNKP
jgi:CheY-like chemotaxis protein